MLTQNPRTVIARLGVALALTAASMSVIPAAGGRRTAEGVTAAP